MTPAQRTPPTARRVLAIDPGPVQSAILELVAGQPEQFGIYLNASILESLWFTNRAAPVMNFYPGTVVIEQVVSYGMAVGAEVFETVRWAGRFEQAAQPAPVVLMPRLKVKQHLCHDGRAKDPNIRAALIDRFGGPAAIRKGGALYGVKADIWSALALAVTYADTAQ